MTDKNSYDEKIIKHRNPVAKDLGTTKYRQRVVDKRLIEENAEDWFGAWSDELYED